MLEKANVSEKREWIKLCKIFILYTHSLVHKQTQVEFLINEQANCTLVNTFGEGALEMAFRYSHLTVG